MSRIVIDLGRDLPRRAAPLAQDALASVFGGTAPCGTERYYCGGELFTRYPPCCAGFVCLTGFVQICVKA